VAAPEAYNADSVGQGIAGNVLWHSTDGGRSWRPLARPSTLTPSPLLASGSLLFAHTVIGDFESSDGGARWRIANDLALVALENRVEPTFSPALVRSWTLPD
jgi:hypothetical protein